MGWYLLRRVLLIPPTLVVIMAINFAIVQFVPGGPIERILASLDHPGTAGALSRVTGGAGDIQTPTGAAPGGGGGGQDTGRYRGAAGLEPEFIKSLEKQFGFDRPPLERFFRMMGDYLVFDFGNSYFHDRPVVGLVLEKMPVSVSLGLLSTLLIYLIAIPLGIGKALRDGSRFDAVSSMVIVAGVAIPSFLFALALVILLAGGQYLDWFPLRGLTSPNHADMDWTGQLLDRLHHLVLPVTALTIGGFAGLSMLTKNSFLEELRKLYVTTARAKGVPERAVILGHVFRNAMLIVISGVPAALIGLLFTGALLIEVIFSLDGMGLLGFEAALNRDYQIMFATLFFFTLLGLVLNVISDLVYVLVDPRIHFGRFEGS